MNSAADPFAKFAGKLTDGEQLRVRGAMDELGLTRTDALFHVMAALEYYRVLYERIPAEIKEAGDRALEAVDKAVEVQSAREVVAARVSLAEEVVDAARKISAKRDSSGTWAFAFFAVVLTLIAVIGAFWVGRLSADDAHASRTAQPMAWFNSSDGQYALFLSRSGVLNALQICRAQNRTLAIGPTKVECGVMNSPMRSARQFSPLPMHDPAAAR